MSDGMGGGDSRGHACPAHLTNVARLEDVTHDLVLVNRPHVSCSPVTFSLGRPLGSICLVALARPVTPVSVHTMLDGFNELSRHLSCHLPGYLCQTRRLPLGLLVILRR